MYQSEAEIDGTTVRLILNLRSKLVVSSYGNDFKGGLKLNLPAILMI